MARITDDSGAGGAQNANHKEPVILRTDGDGTVSVPNADFISNADIARDGQNLVLTAPDGSVVVIENYFLAEPAPVIETADGQVLTPNMVLAFIHHAGPVTLAAAEGAMNDGSPVGEVREVSGDATVTRTDGTTVRIVTGTVIYQGDIVETDAEGAVNITFVDESSFSVSENARLAIDSYVFDPSSQSGETNFSMLRGVFIYTSGLIGREDPDDVQIDTPKGSIGIRGTIIAGNVETGEITVVEGAIVLRSPTGEEMTLATQFGTAKFMPGSGEILSMGVLDSGAVNNAFSALNSVTPGFFSALDSGPAHGSDSGQSAPDSQKQDEQNPGQSQDPDSSDHSAIDPSAGSFGENNVFGDSNTFSTDSVPQASDSASANSGSSASAAIATGQSAPPASAAQANSNTVSANNAPSAPPPFLNASAPVVANGGTLFNMPENTLSGSAVGPVAATDADGNFLTYSITGGNAGGVFSIDSGGTLRVSGGLNYEAVTSYNLTVQVSDGAHSTTALYTVNIGDINETPAANATTFNIDEDSINGTSLGTVTASDPESGTLSYSIMSGNTGGVFSIDANTGEITTANPLDFEGLSQYVLTIGVSDGVNVGTTSIVIDINNVDDTAPVVAANTGGSADEGASLVLTTSMLNSSDVDTGNASLTYTVTGGLSNGQLELTTAPGTGITSFTQDDLDSGRVVYVHDGGESVSDSFTFDLDDGTNGGPTGTVFNIAVTSVNDAPVLTPNTPSFTAIAEDAASPSGQTVLGLVNGFITDAEGDPDGIAVVATDNSNGTWEFSTDNGTTWNAVPAVSGTSALLLGASDKLRFVPDPDFNGAADITYRAWDGTAGTAGSTVNPIGGAFSAAADTATITVNPVNDAPVITTATFSIDENSAGGAAVGTITTATDIDLDSLTFSETGNGTGAGLFAIDAGGNITVETGAVLNYEATTSYTYEVSVSDGNGGVDTVMMTINVSDVLNENIAGTAGADTLTGSVGNDTLNGFDGNDTLSGGAGDDALSGGNQNDILIGGAGNDFMDGGAGTDTADYSSSTGAINIDMGSGIFQDGMGGTDTLNNIETVIGSAFNDTLRGEGGSQTLMGGSGNDTLKGSGGTDVLDGGIGTDTADYSMYGFANNLSVNLNSAGSATITSAAGNDTLTGIENIIGTQGADTISGITDTATNVIDGNLGNDHLTAGNNDTLIGGAGNDWLEYNGGVAQNFDLRGDAGADTITINSALNISNADGKNMFIKGGTGGGNDTLEFNAIGAITLNPNGVQDIIQEIEVYDFQNNLANTINVTFSSLMVSANDGGLLTLQVDYTDNLTFNFGGLGYHVVSGDINMKGTANYIEFQQDAGPNIVRIEYTVNAGATGSITILGSSGGGGTLNLNQVMAGMTAGSEGFAITDNVGKGFGNSITMLGDINGDGYDDLGMTRAKGPGDNGSVFILPGVAGGYTTNMELASMPGTIKSGLFNDPGASSANVSNMVIDTIGDFNGDGVADYIVGAPLANDIFVGDPATGNIQIVSGANGSVLVDLKSLTTSDLTGTSVAGIGDVNGDGFDDVVVGAPGAGGHSGSGYILFGNAYGSGTALDVNVLSDTNYMGDLGLSAFNADPKDIEIYNSPIIGPVAFVMKANNEINIVNVQDPDSASVSGAILNNASINALTGYSASGGATNPMNGLVDIVVKGNFLYILSGNVSGSEGQVTVLNITDPVNPVFVDCLHSTSLFNATGLDVDLVTGKLAVIQSSGGTGSLMQFAAAADGKIGTTSVGDATMLGTTSAQSALNGASEVIVNNGFAYVISTTLGTTRIVNLSTNTVTGTSLATANVTNMFLDQSSKHLYVLSGTGGTGSLKVYDVTSASSPSLIGSYSSATLAMASDIIVHDNIAYITTSGGVSVLDVSTPAAIISLPALFNPGGVMADASALALDPYGYLHVLSTTSDTLTTTDIQANGIRLDGAALDLLGMNVSAAGDFNHDGISDFMITRPHESGTGEVYLVLGQKDMKSLDLGTDPNVLHLTGISVDHSIAAESQIPVFYLGDLNRDGASDIAVGHTGGAGQISVYWGAGAPGGGDTTADFNITPGAGYQIISGDATGDFNGDGVDDAAIVLQNIATPQNLDIYVLYGKSSLTGTINKTFLDNSSNAFHMTYVIPPGADASDFTLNVSAAGDLNGDGYADVVVGLPDLDNDSGINTDGAGGTNDDADGSAVIVYGRNGGGASIVQNSGVVNATANGQSLVGSNAIDYLHANAFSDISFRGGGGQDFVYLKTANFNDIDGGAGHDYILFDNTGTLDFSAFTKEDIKRIEEIDVLPTSGSTVILTMQNIFDFMETSDNSKFRISSQGTSNHFQIDNMGTGAQAGATLEQVSQLLGADSYNNNTVSGYYELHFGGQTLELGYTVMVPGGVDIV